MPLFLSIGLVGLCSTNAILAVLHGRLSFPLPVSAATGWEVGLLVTFVLNCNLTWRGRATGGVLKRLRNYQTVAMMGLAIYLAVVLVATWVVGTHYILSSLMGSCVTALWNYTAYHHVVFRPSTSR